METWKPITGTKGFIEVSNEGRVRSLLTGTPRVLKTQVDNRGYHRIRVTIEREKKSYKVHREVANAFINNPDNLPQVNHKDGDKNNNSASNLEWVTNKENAHHAIKNGLWDSVLEGSRKENESRKKPILAYRIDDKYPCTRYYESINAAERDIGSRHICDVLKGKRTHVKGWAFQYAKGGDQL
ncbi:MAG: NUMOD4 domain-containing protein [Clostridia bacterium]|nr:NUMOD4 domain-containing protein [Clostridia bacterium]